MAISETLTSIVAVIAGLLIGMFFFGGLWWTVRRGVASPSPALWFFTSLLLRMGMAMAGFYWVGRLLGHATWQPLLLCLLGFLLARPLL
ncbi:MAG: ATP synthase subunit I, partial [Planctomycetes bacterium]|nr:ATP synthase subunit I [Planctomycetota bacterium]